MCVYIIVAKTLSTYLDSGSANCHQLLSYIAIVYPCPYNSASIGEIYYVSCIHYRANDLSSLGQMNIIHL